MLIKTNINHLQALGDSLNLLDLDKDGELTVAELKGAIKKILKRTITEDEAQEIVMLIDKDNDGKGKQPLIVIDLLTLIFIVLLINVFYLILLN